MIDSGDNLAKYDLKFDQVTLRRRFPFRARNAKDAVRARNACNEALRNVQDMIVRYVKDAMPSYLSSEDIEDIVQDCNKWLFTKSLPKYDTRRKVKVSTFLGACIWNFVRQRRRGIMSRRFREMRGAHTYSLSSLESMIAAPDDTSDRMVEMLAKAVIDDPERFLTSHQAFVLRAIINSQAGQTSESISSSLNYKRPSSFSTMKKTIREKLAEIDISAFEIDGQVLVDKKV